MPRKYQKKRAPAKKRPRKRYASKRSTPSMGLSLPMGKSFKMKSRYIELAIPLDVGVGGIPTSYVFSLNGLFDPNHTGTGHQPIGFDQLMGMYDHYNVIGTKYTVTFTNTDTVNQAIVCCQVKDTDTTSINLSEIIENGQAKYTVLSTETAGGCCKTLHGGVSIKKFFGKSPMSTKYGGTDGSNPADGVWLHVINAPADGVTNTDPVLINVQLDYIVVFTEPKQLGQS